jgi:hypothetical protein
MAVVLGVSMLGYRFVHPVGTVLGLFGIKISALMQPVLTRFWRQYKQSDFYLNRKQKGRG